MNLWYFLSQPFAQHALAAGTLVAIACGLIGPFVISRGMAFAVHGTSELAFSGAAAGLLVADNPVLGAYVGSLVVASVLGVLGAKERERDATIGVILAFGLGLGVLFLSYYHGFATQATNILFGNIFGVGNDQLLTLLLVSVAVLVITTFIFRPLLFASVDPDVARAKGLPISLLSIVFLFVLALTVTSAAQIVGTLLVLSLAITPAAAAQRLATRPATIVLLSIVFALIASIGGIVASLISGTIKPSILVTTISFGLYVFARVVGTSPQRKRSS